MSDFDHLALDGHLLALLVAVVEERSVTGAAHRLGVSQSTVSHLLEKLRQMSPDWPVPDYDIEAEKERLANS